ncbi:TetR family transcriptional regulator, partial [Dermatophilus congolensis]
RQTRARIHRSAVELTDQHGLDTLTIEAIAARADVSPRTVFNYYRSKEAAILGIDSDIPEQVTAALEQQPPNICPLTALRNALRSLITAPRIDEEFTATRRRVLTDHPELATTSMSLVIETEKSLTKALLTRLTHNNTDTNNAHLHMQAALLATAAVGATRATWVTRAHHDLDPQSTLETFERAFDALQTGLPPHPHSNYNRTGATTSAYTSNTPIPINNNVTTYANGIARATST